MKKSELRFQLKKLEELLGDVVRVNKLHWPSVADIVQGVEPQSSPFMHIVEFGTVNADTVAYQSGYVGGWNARENTQGGDWTAPVRLPDGSGVMIGSFPLPKDHWIYEKDEDGFQPKMPEHMKWSSASAGVKADLTEALKVAIRGATNGGKEMDFDPDALILNFFAALFRPSKNGRVTIAECDPDRQGGNNE